MAVPSLDVCFGNRCHNIYNAIYLLIYATSQLTLRKFNKNEKI